MHCLSLMFTSDIFYVFNCCYVIINFWITFDQLVWNKYPVNRKRIDIFTVFKYIVVNSQ